MWPPMGPPRRPRPSGAPIPADARTPRLRGLLHAPERIRTSTGHTAHKALNLARLPVPPQARGRASIATLESVGTARYGTNTCSLVPSLTDFVPGSRSVVDGPHEAPARDLRLHQALLGQVRLSADGARYRQSGGAGLVVDRPRPSRQPGEGWAPAA